MQPRFERRSGNGPTTLVEQPRFRAGFDFLRLRAAAGEASQELAEWWEAFSLADNPERRELMDVARQQDLAKRQARSASGEGKGDSDAVAGEAPAKKRRRRRRKPAGEGAGVSVAAGDSD